MKHIEIAIKELGKEEIPRGSNWGEHVKKYLHSVDIDFPASWCMAFIYWCVEESKIRITMSGAAGLRNPLVKTGGVIRQWKEIETQFCQPKCKFTDPLPGDIFIMDFGKGLGHTGFVESIEGDKIHTIEGNTNDEGSREGYEVCRRVRKISSCLGFIRVNN
ncbi:MAG: CHAP domain-containing protein [Bacteroidota bacterium]